jgi:hypothetical protein
VRRARHIRNPGGQLVAEGFSRSRGKNHDLILALEGIGDNVTLDRIKVGDGEVPPGCFGYGVRCSRCYSFLKLVRKK